MYRTKTQRGAAMVELVMVLPLLIILYFFLIQVSAFSWKTSETVVDARFQAWSERYDEQTTTTRLKFDEPASNRGDRTADSNRSTAVIGLFKFFPETKSSHVVLAESWGDPEINEDMNLHPNYGIAFEMVTQGPAQEFKGRKGDITRHIEKLQDLLDGGVDKLIKSLLPPDIESLVNGTIGKFEDFLDEETLKEYGLEMAGDFLLEKIIPEDAKAAYEAVKEVYEKIFGEGGAYADAANRLEEGKKKIQEAKQEMIDAVEKLKSKAKAIGLSELTEEIKTAKDALKNILSVEKEEENNEDEKEDAEAEPEDEELEDQDLVVDSEKELEDLNQVIENIEEQTSKIEGSIDGVVDTIVDSLKEIVEKKLTKKDVEDTANEGVAGDDRTSIDDATEKIAGIANKAFGNGFEIAKDKIKGYVDEALDLEKKIQETLGKVKKGIQSVEVIKKDIEDLADLPEPPEDLDEEEKEEWLEKAEEKLKKEKQENLKKVNEASDKAKEQLELLYEQVDNFVDAADSIKKGYDDLVGALDKGIENIDGITPPDLPDLSGLPSIK